MSRPASFLFVLLTVLLLSCTPSRHSVLTTAAHRSDTSRVTVADTIRITVADTIRITVADTTVVTAEAVTHHRDSTVTSETVTTTFDPTTGHPVEQVVQRSVTQVADISVLSHIIAMQQHTIDSLALLNRTLTSAHQLDSMAVHGTDTLTVSDIRERGDASLSPLHKAIRRLWQTALCICVLSLLIAKLLQSWHTNH